MTTSNTVDETKAVDALIYNTTTLSIASIYSFFFLSTMLHNWHCHRIFLIIPHITFCFLKQPGTRYSGKEYFFLVHSSSCTAQSYDEIGLKIKWEKSFYLIKLFSCQRFEQSCEKLQNFLPNFIDESEQESNVFRCSGDVSFSFSNKKSIAEISVDCCPTSVSSAGKIKCPLLFSIRFACLDLKAMIKSSAARFPKIVWRKESRSFIQTSKTFSILLQRFNGTLKRGYISESRTFQSQAAFRL